MRISQTATNILPSPTIEIKRIADQLKSQGHQVFDFGVGEMNPSIQVPEVMKKAISDATFNDHTHYNPPQGDAKVLEALSRDFKNFRLNYSPSEIAMFPGPKPALWAALMAILDPNHPKNRVAAFTPVYEAFTDIPKLITGKDTILLETDAECLPNIDVLSAMLKSRDDICCLIINNPNNPSGRVYSKELLSSIADLVKQHPDIVIISDEVYRCLIYEEDYVSIASFLPQQTILVGGISKEVAGTGLRLGFAAGPKQAIDAMHAVVGATLSCTSLIVQRGYAEFLSSDQDLTTRNQIKAILKEKRDLILSLFKELPGFKRLRVLHPGGAFYVFPSIEGFIGLKTPQGDIISSDEQFCIWILKEAKIVLLPGSKFSKAGYFRLAYASSSLAEIREGIQRLSDFLLQLKPANDQ